MIISVIFKKIAVKDCINFLRRLDFSENALGRYEYERIKTEFNILKPISVLPFTELLFQN